MADRHSEIELKFALTPEAATALGAGLFGGVDGDDLVSTYFDTPGRALQKTGAALRLRKTGQGWVQTLKAGPHAVKRFEDEHPVAGDRLDPRLLPKTGLGRDGEIRAGSKAAGALAPVFETHVRRRARRLEHDGAVVEAALDQGEIVAGDRREPLRELELELKSGRVGDLLALARPYVAAGGATLSLISKAERGYRLASAEAPTAVRFVAPPLDFDAAAHEGLQVLAMAALHQLSANIDLLRERPSLEAVHQARVGLRRLKTFLNAFAGLVGDDLGPDGRAPAITAAIDRLARIFEAPRMLDVLQANVFGRLAHHEPGAAAFGAALMAARTRAYAELQTALQGSAGADLFEVVAWVLDGPWTRAAAAANGPCFRRSAERALAHRWNVLRKRGRALDWDDAPARHKLRIQAKRMRYLAEALLDPPAAKALLKRLEALQAALGELNDIATAPDAVRLALAGASPPDAAFAAGAMVGERRAEQAGYLKAARKAFRRLNAAEIRWSDVRERDTV